MVGKHELGSILRDCRRQKNISQADLARGICSMSNLSRVEHGEFEAPIIMAQALLERLGVGFEKFEMLLEEEDYRLYWQSMEIKHALQEGQAALARQRLESYDKRSGKWDAAPTAQEGKYSKEIGKDKLNTQYVKYCEAEICLLEMQDGSRDPAERERLSKEASRLLEEAEGLTIVEKGWNMLLNRTEMGILLAKPEGLSLEELKHIQHFAKAYYPKEWMGKFYPQIQLKYANALAEKGKCRKALAEIEEGLAVLKGGNSYHHCADLYFLSAQIYGRMGGGSLSEKAQGEIVKRCQQAYGLYALDGSAKAEAVRRYLGENG